MRVDGARVIVTGSASGLGAALATESLDRGATAVALWDRDRQRLDQVASSLGSRAIPVYADLSDPLEVEQGLAATDSAMGTTDILIANAGVIQSTGLDSPTAEWDLSWQVHITSVMQMARALLPEMLEHRSGHIAITASSTAMTLNPKSIVYSVTKRAQHAMAEWLKARYIDSGVGFTTFLPGGISTPLHARMGLGDPHSRVSADEADTPQQAASLFLDGIEAGETTVYSKARTEMDLQKRAFDYDGWIGELANRFPEPRDS